MAGDWWTGARSWLAPPSPRADPSMITCATGRAHEEMTRRLQRSITARGLDGTEAGRVELDAQLRERLQRNRDVVVPWLASLQPLAGARVLEIGTGTGASTVALAERGALVTGIDIDASSLELAALRLEAHGLRATLLECNACDAARRLEVGAFDLVIFYASLEHMTHPERQTAMAATWGAMRPGAHWCIIDTPNRLWWFDSHTSLLPFFHWLPDDVALDYLPHSPRAGLREGFSGGDAVVKLARFGRALSIQDVQLALGAADAQRVASCLTTFHRQQSIRRRLAAPLSRDGAFELLLRWIAPELPAAYALPYLDLALRKGPAVAAPAG